LEKIHFNVNSFEVESNYKEILNKVAAYMKSDKKIKLEINGFTSSTGIPGYNLSLAKRRADAVKNYLVSKGVSSSNLIPVGKGQTNFLNHCSEGVDCSEEEHKINQRVELSWK
jgi:outer membrane protein OmpA-like peptidoglycan-associated protein